MKMQNFRDTRIGITHAAGLLGVSVRELKEAVQQNKPLKGSEVPAPIIRASGHYQWMAGDLMDFSEIIKVETKG